MFRTCLAFQKRFPVYRVFTPRISMFSSVSKTFLDVPFDMKDEAKLLGAKWDKDTKKWYITEETDASPFQKFLRVYLTVPFAEKDEAKALGARWDKEKSRWYVSGFADLTQFQKWINSSNEPVPSKSTPSRVSSTDPAAKSAPLSTASAVASPPYATRSSPRSSTDGGATRATDPKQNILLLSVDTNGLPKQDNGKYLPYDDLLSYDTSRLIQISYQLCRLQDLSRISNDTYTIQSDGFPIDNSQFHNITLQMSKSSGVSFMDAAEK
eukprot:gene14701-17193_t